MRTLIVVGLFAIACGGGSSGQSVSPAGTWTVTDTLAAALSRVDCAAGGTETLVVTGKAIQGYAMTASSCEAHYCELQGSLGDSIRDVGFYGDGTLSGTRTVPRAAPEVGCVYFTEGARAH